MELSDNITTIIVSVITVVGGGAAEVLRRRLLKRFDKDDAGDIAASSLPGEGSSTRPETAGPRPVHTAPADASVATEEDDGSMAPSGVDAALLTAINGTFDRLQSEINRYAEESRRWRDEARKAQDSLDRANDIIEELRTKQQEDKVTIDRLVQQLTAAKAEINVITRLLNENDVGLSTVQGQILQARESLKRAVWGEDEEPALPPGQTPQPPKGGSI